MENRTQEQLMAELARLQAENEKLKAKTNRPITLKVSEKGALSAYNLNARFPVTLYRQQWEKLLASSDQIKAFIEANKDHLAVKE